MGKKNKSLFWILNWCLFYTLSMALAKSISIEIEVLVFLRLLLSMIFFLPFIKKIYFTSINLTQEHEIKIFVQAIFICLSMYCTYYAYRHLPLSLATSIGYSTPLFTLVLSYFFLKEKITLRSWVFIVFGYIGILITVKPSLSSMDYPILIALLANIFYSFMLIITKSIIQKIPYYTLMFYRNIVSIIFFGILAYSKIIDLSFESYISIFYVAMAASISQLSYLQAIKYDNLEIIVPFEYSRIIFAIPLGVLFFQENIPDNMFFIGLAIVFISNLFIFIKNASYQNIKS